MSMARIFGHLWSRKVFVMIFRQALAAVLLVSGSAGSGHARPILQPDPKASVLAPVAPPIQAAAKDADLTEPEIFEGETYNLIERGTAQQLAQEQERRRIWRDTVASANSFEVEHGARPV